MATNLQVIEQQLQRRDLRRPQHTFIIRQQPWAITPFMIAPVLPGETMRNLLLQARVVTDPILNKLTGWWIEYYFFYVKLTDLDGRDDFKEMMLDLNKDVSSYYEAASEVYYHFGSQSASANSINWTKLCLKRCVEEYFRDEGIAWDAVSIGGLPAAMLGNRDWRDSALLASEFEDSAVDIDVDLDANTTITASEVQRALQQYTFLKDHNLTDMSYEDFLRSYGIRVGLAEEAHRPELCRYVREWSYPVNTVDPNDGSVASAVSWAIRERADKDRFFSEPGFLLGVSVARPKVYSAGLEGSAASLLEGALAWLPAALTNDKMVSWRRLDAGHGPVDVGDEAYWVDLRDLFMHGDQFNNYGIATGYENHLVPLDAIATGAWPRYFPTEAISKGVFVDAAGTDFYVRQDGIVSLNIASSQRDMSPRAVEQGV